MRTVYLASPLGFAQSTIPYMNDLAARLRKYLEVHNPWDDTSLDHLYIRADRKKNVYWRATEMAKLNQQLGKRNHEAIDKCETLLAVLDGVDVDSGTAAEIGYAFAKEKLIIGLRTDFRLAGDNPGATVNLQVEYFINESGGEIYGSTDQLLKMVKEVASMRDAHEPSADS